MKSAVSKGVANSIVKFAHSLGFDEPVHIGDGIFSCAATIVPDLALRLTTEFHIENNRNKKTSAIPVYAADMAAGLWALIHQGIAFNRQRLLFDDNNRCKSCVFTQKSFRTLVFFNLETDTLVNVDSGVKRSPLDAAKIRGISLTSRTAPAIRFLVCGTKSASAPRMSNEEILGCAEMFTGALSFIDDQFKTHVRHVTTAPVVAAIGRAWMYCETEEGRLIEFCEVFRDGTSTRRDRDSAAQVAYKYLTQTKSAAGWHFQASVYRKIQNALHHFLHESKIQKLQEQSADLFPLSDEFKRRMPARIQKYL